MNGLYAIYSPVDNNFYTKITMKKRYPDSKFFLIERIIKYFMRNKNFSWEARNEIFQALLFVSPQCYNRLIVKYNLDLLYDLPHYFLH